MTSICPAGGGRAGGTLPGFDAPCRDPAPTAGTSAKRRRPARSAAPPGGQGGRQRPLAHWTLKKSVVGYGLVKPYQA